MVPQLSTTDPVSDFVEITIPDSISFEAPRFRFDAGVCRPLDTDLVPLRLPVHLSASIQPGVYPHFS